LGAEEVGLGLEGEGWGGELFGGRGGGVCYVDGGVEGDLYAGD